MFLDDLKSEFEEIKKTKVQKTKYKKLDDFQDKLAELTFLDPACGSGNFLTETYLSLRHLENEVIKEKIGGQITLGDEAHNPIKVSIQQFYGIEINDFAVTVAKTAQGILDARKLYKTKTLAEMYGRQMYLYPELKKAHRDNDRAVMKVYGFSIKDMSEEECVSELMKMYKKLSDEK